MSDVEALKALARETKNMVESLLQKHNLLVIKSGIVQSVNGNKYIVRIEKKDFEIYSQLKFETGAVVSVLTDARMMNKKFSLFYLYLR